LKESIDMIRTTLSAAAVLAVGLLAACGASTTGTSPSATPTATPVPAATPTPASTATAVPTSIDPCQLVTASEASSLAGVSYGAGTEEATPGRSKRCIYGSQTLNVLAVIVAVAPDATTAQADWAGEQAQVKAGLQASAQGANVNVSINDTSNLSGADKAAVGTGTATIAGKTLYASVIYFLKGPTFVSFSDLVLGHASPSVSAMEAEANTVLGRI
jgi:hypothetical protein